MPRKSISFPGAHGQLAGVLELAARGHRGMALFAHCFTCGKDSVAATKICRALAAEGVSVLRFDFTGLGGSDGDFGNAGFAGNVEDLVAAARFLEAEYSAPTLLIGHSLGGTAVLAAAGEVESCRAVVTIGAPASPEHVLHQFERVLPTIEAEGEAEVSFGGPAFRIRREFVDELRETSVAGKVRGLRRALLIMHSPLDEVVGIDEASRLFANALHPKSFVSLDRADHMLSNRADAEFVAATIAGWAGRYLSPAARPAADGTGMSRNHVVISEGNHRFLRDISTDDHNLIADEPEPAGGDNLGPDPYELLLAALGACTSMTIRMYANHKQWPLEDVGVELDHRREHAEDCEGCEGNGAKLEVIRRRLVLTGKLDDAQRARLVEIADRCPVHRTLTGRLEIETELVADEVGRDAS